MKQEYRFLLIGSLLLVAYVLEALVKPLSLNLSNPFEFLTPKNFQLFPFTFTIILIRSAALAMIPGWLLSFLKGNFQLKWIVLLTCFGLLELYSIQEVATGSKLMAYEWSIALSLSGLLLVPQIIVYFFASFFVKTPKVSSPNHDSSAGA